MDFLKKSKRFSFMYGDKPFWDLNPYVKAAENGNSLEIEYTLPDGLKVTNIAKAYPDFDAYEWVTWFENTSEKPSNVISKLYQTVILKFPLSTKSPSATPHFCLMKAPIQKFTRLQAQHGTKESFTVTWTNTHSKATQIIFIPVIQSITAASADVQAIKQPRFSMYLKKTTA